MSTFSQRLKELRKEKNISLDKLSYDLQTTKATLSRYENGLRDPKSEVINQLSEYFNVSVDYLLGKRNTKDCKQFVSFGDRLKELREQYGKSQDELSVILNVSRSNISKYENGLLEPNIESIKKLSMFFGVSLDYLLGIHEPHTNIAGFLDNAKMQPDIEIMNEDANTIPPKYIDFISDEENHMYIEFAIKMKDKKLNPNDILGFLYKFQ